MLKHSRILYKGSVYYFASVDELHVCEKVRFSLL